MSSQVQVGDKLKPTPTGVTDNCEYADQQRLKCSLVVPTELCQDFLWFPKEKESQESHKSPVLCPMFVYKTLLTLQCGTRDSPQFSPSTLLFSVLH